LEVGPPPQAQRVQLVRASTSALELSWTSIPNAQHYLLEVQKLPLVVAEEKKEVPKVMAPSPVKPQQPMFIVQQQKKPMLQTIPTIRAPSVFKVMPAGKAGTPVVVSSASGATFQVQRPTFTGNVIKLMPGSIISGNKIIMKPATSTATTMIRPTIRPAGMPITIGGRTVTLQLAGGQGQKKMTIVGNQLPTVRAGGPQQKIIMMPSGSIVQQVATTQQVQQPKIEQLDGAIDDDFESQISTVKIEKQTADEGGEVKVSFGWKVPRNVWRKIKIPRNFNEMHEKLTKISFPGHNKRRERSRRNPQHHRRALRQHDHPPARRKSAAEFAQRIASRLADHHKPVGR
jgi:hypothetical protein